MITIMIRMAVVFMSVLMSMVMIMIISTTMIIDMATKKATKAFWGISFCWGIMLAAWENRAGREPGNRAGRVPFTNPKFERINPPPIGFVPKLKLKLILGALFQFYFV